VVTGGLGIAVLTAVSVPVAAKVLADDPGKLVTPLLRSRPFYVAHHGGNLDWPEMSMEAYRRSVDLGVDALEISLARSADGVWFGLHDKSLDRTSGTTGFVASEHSWAEISQYTISASGLRGAGQAAQPYLRFEDLVHAYASTHTIFVDPKAVSHDHYHEVLALMDAATATPTESFIAKSYCTDTAWADAAHARGYRTWGYYYGKELDDGTVAWQATQASWDLIGLDYGASPSAWTSARALGKPVLGHVIPDARAASIALRDGAVGLMVSGIQEVLRH
jgi:hypothetical protein